MPELYYYEYPYLITNEIEELAIQYNIKEELVNIKEWYNGYFFGDTTIYNPCPY